MPADETDKPTKGEEQVTQQRSIENRIAAIQAAVDQQTSTTEELARQVRNLAVTGIYIGGLVLLLVLILKSGRFKLPAGLGAGE